MTWGFDIVMVYPVINVQHSDHLLWYWWSLSGYFLTLGLSRQTKSIVEDLSSDMHISIYSPSAK